jgi:hypothetical protein
VSGDPSGVTVLGEAGAKYLNPTWHPLTNRIRILRDDAPFTKVSTGYRCNVLFREWGLCILRSYRISLLFTYIFTLIIDLINLLSTTSFTAIVTTMSTATFTTVAEMETVSHLEPTFTHTFHATLLQRVCGCLRYLMFCVPPTAAQTRGAHTDHPRLPLPLMH